MPLGNLKAIGQLHLSGKVPRRADGAHKDGDEGGERWEERGKIGLRTTQFQRANGAAAVFALKIWRSGKEIQRDLFRNHDLSRALESVSLEIVDGPF